MIFDKPLQEEQLRRILKFVGVTVSGWRLSCAVHGEFSFFQRESRAGLQRSPFTARAAIAVLDSMERVDTALAAAGQPRLPRHLYTEF